MKPEDVQFGAKPLTGLEGLAPGVLSVLGARLMMVIAHKYGTYTFGGIGKI